MEDTRAVSDAIVSILQRYTGGRTPIVDATTSLGSGGVGLDSIAIAELLIDCNMKLGVDASSLLDGSDITFGRLVQFVAAQTADA